MVNYLSALHSSDQNAPRYAFFGAKVTICRAVICRPPNRIIQTTTEPKAKAQAGVQMLITSNDRSQSKQISSKLTRRISAALVRLIRSIRTWQSGSLWTDAILSVHLLRLFLYRKIILILTFSILFATPSPSISRYCVSTGVSSTDTVNAVFGVVSTTSYFLFAHISCPPANFRIICSSH